MPIIPLNWRSCGSRLQLQRFPSQPAAITLITQPGLTRIFYFWRTAQAPRMCFKKAAVAPEACGWLSAHHGGRPLIQFLKSFLILLSQFLSWSWAETNYFSCKADPMHSNSPVKWRKFQDGLHQPPSLMAFLLLNLKQRCQKNGSSLRQIN